MNLSVNKSLRSHCNKRGSQQLCAENPSASGLSQYFRAGWQSAANTMLKYIAGSVALERPAAKAVAKWPARDGCGEPVVFDDILASPGLHHSPPSSQDSEPFTSGPVVGYRDKLQRFTDALFDDDQDGLWGQKVRELLVSSLLLRYDQFLDVLRSHPAAWIPECTLKNYDPQDERFDLEKSQEHCPSRSVAARIRQSSILHHMRIRPATQGPSPPDVRALDSFPIQRSDQILRRIESTQQLTLYLRCHNQVLRRQLPSRFRFRQSKRIMEGHGEEPVEEPHQPVCSYQMCSEDPPPPRTKLSQQPRQEIDRTDGETSRREDPHRLWLRQERDDHPL
ncbi:hypothetical protein SEMRO_1500_G277810.1 [Seminavis robusta]|uniref:Uncharacterized protein n=1 Tax=Seminavis robusta TaxID=568900 RepID=A0A9N8ENY6_9STRA|nr:hypothetical protein SEMRO_1500_G277810.1 [Seminavis robusta]|eukprot:Sro1500_g277810.1 n/a (336) ;mRNA; f:5445-6748